MAGPPSDDYATLTFNFGGAALPLGAHPAMGLLAAGALDQAFLDAIVTPAIALVEATCPSTVDLIELQMKVGPVASGPTYFSSVAMNGNQNSATDSPATALLVRKLVTGFSTRLSGRMFWPTPSSVDIENGGLLGSASLSQFQTAFDDFFDFIDTPGSKVVVFPAGSGTPKEVSSLQVQSRVATQRGRNRR